MAQLCSYREMDFTLFIIGLLAIYRMTVSIINYLSFMIYVYFWPRSMRTNLRKKYGQWAAVTGSTSGIGRDLANSLASRGFDIVLISRSDPRLKQAAYEIESKYGVKTKVVVANALDRSSNQKVLDTCRNLDLGILVNNVGLNSPTGLDDMYQIDSGLVYDMISVNCGTLATLTRDLMPIMLKNNKGLIVNIGSTSGYIPLPYQNIYNATKRFSMYLTDLFNIETYGTGIDVMNVYPQFVRTGMTQGCQFVHNLKYFTRSSSEYAEGLTEAMGRSVHSAGFWIFDINILILLMMPLEMQLKLCCMIINMLRKLNFFL